MGTGAVTVLPAWVLEHLPHACCRFPAVSCLEHHCRCLPAVSACLACRYLPFLLNYSAVRFASLPAVGGCAATVACRYCLLPGLGAAGTGLPGAPDFAEPPPPPAVTAVRYFLPGLPLVPFCRFLPAGRGPAACVPALRYTSTCLQWAGCLRAGA